MKNKKQLSLAIALMMGTTLGVQTMGMNSASAEISDKFKMEINGVIGYISDNDNLGGYTAKSQDTGDTESYWNSYTRLQLQYRQDKNTMLQARLHSDYESFGTDYAKVGKTGSYFDQTFLQVKDPKANMTYILGKKGAFLGQGLIHNSSGNLTGAQVSFGNWYDPQCLQLLYGQKKDGSKFLAANYTKDVMKNWQVSLTGIRHDPLTKYTFKEDANGSYTNAADPSLHYSKIKRNQMHLLSIGSKIKGKGVTVQGEYVYNFADEVGDGHSVSMKDGKGKAYTNTLMDNSKSSRKGWYIEAYTGPTSDMTSGLPLQKPGTNVWSLKYQDVGANATDAHNTTFFDDAKGWRLDYGHTFKKGLAADIAVAHMKDKGGSDFNDPENGKWKTLVCAQVNYKFR